MDIEWILMRVCEVSNKIKKIRYYDFTMLLFHQTVYLTGFIFEIEKIYKIMVKRSWESFA